MEVELIKDDTRAMADFDEPAVEAAAETMPNGASNLVGALLPRWGPDNFKSQKCPTWLCLGWLTAPASLRHLPPHACQAQHAHAGSGEAQCPEGQAGAGQQDA